MNQHYVPQHALEAEASPVRLHVVSDHLTEAANIIEAAWMAAADLSQPSERDAMRTILHVASQLVEGAVADIDTYRGKP
jgi:hypothetical protein